MHTLIGYSFAVFTALLVLGGDFLIKVAADGDEGATSRLMLLASAIYGASAFLWFVCMRHITLAQAGVAFSMFSLLALCAMGVVLFGERIGPREFAGIGCALAAMVLMIRFA